ncbi:hypothetical protein [Nocardioides mesophilus]|uniref:Uncharacterized protein n=1 Tax=Nocardioides mesophilus TaxID=433659 RepID=A0A7G9RB42_9ACTN|nr:hypothetical protein [Nocardioides mesophilus]QNN52817.1 hypothetical protein H9L09_20725 [Nocardioides mesophilus]
MTDHTEQPEQPEQPDQPDQPYQARVLGLVPVTAVLDQIEGVCHVGYELCTVLRVRVSRAGGLHLPLDLLRSQGIEVIDVRRVVTPTLVWPTDPGSAHA